MLIDNIVLLKERFPQIREMLIDFEENQGATEVKKVNSKSGKVTLQVSSDDDFYYLHSKYDPVNEATRLIKQYIKKVEACDHIFFYGIGLAYHVEVLMQKYPNKTFTLYEPNVEIMYHYLSEKQLAQLPLEQLDTIHIEKDRNSRLQFLTRFFSRLNKKVLLVPLPSYERIFNDSYLEFIHDFKEKVTNNRMALHVNLSYQVRWTLNAVKNLPLLLKTPNIMLDVNNKYFSNKPAIIVSAGPSLTEEIDNLRYIKQKGLAYIFSVGSAINTLIDYDIYPDAACTYDPTEKNQVVFDKLKERNIKEIPLIFGSSVGFETLEDYPGALIHMVTNQDNISPTLLKNRERAHEVVVDSPSIAIITLQLLMRLGFSKIILVGQNLAYKNEKSYAEGIDYNEKYNHISDEVKKNLITVESVDGSELLTSKSFLRMKKSLEHYIANNEGAEILNTTTGGAKITGAPFIRLTDVIKTKLVDKDIVDSMWLNEKPNYDLDYTKKQVNFMVENEVKLNEDLQTISNILKRMNLKANSSGKSINKLINQFEKTFKSITGNTFYLSFILPTIKVNYDVLVRNSKEISFEYDQQRKVALINKHYGNYITNVMKSYHYISRYYKEMLEQIKNHE
ncbi:motility associated factor glycosyltransferase family protein [Amphibacillus cookii]|uniref:motility associated factor glycosyltransferase family protein n=1 Tax=Amphibacillus cookii TaxID=767787 RepID=UPI001956D1E5|nr:6-hydroxymethylpterin diphosphokinase MptE-like protein [Amphibacillus cookii]MBM7540029.1 hypothetical protein [Amphibacillus cookii]